MNDRLVYCVLNIFWWNVSLIALLCFVDKDFQGRKIRVQVASRKIPAGAPPHALGMGTFIYLA